MIDFDKMVTRHIEREQRGKKIGRYYPSEAGSCVRKAWYSYKFPQEIQPELLKIFEVGNIMHGFVVEVLKSEKNKDVELLQSELPLRIERKNYTISGRVDDLVLVKESGRKVLIEVKSTKSLQFTEKPGPSHVMQLLLYMYATEIHDGIILYIDKNNLQSRVFPVEFSLEEVEKIMNRFDALHESLVSGSLPEAEAKQRAGMGWMCKFCEYAGKCEMNGK